MADQLCPCTAGERLKWRWSPSLGACVCDPAAFGGVWDFLNECKMANDPSPDVYWGCSESPNTGKCTKTYNTFQGYFSQQECEGSNECIKKYWNCAQNDPGNCLQMFPPTSDNYETRDLCMQSARCAPPDTGVYYGCNEKNNGRCVVGGKYGREAQFQGLNGYQDCMSSLSCRLPNYWGCENRNSGKCTMNPVPGQPAGNNGRYLTEQECLNSAVCAAFTYDCAPFSNFSSCTKLPNSSGRFLSMAECEADKFCKQSWKPAACNAIDGSCQGLGLLFFMPQVDAVWNNTDAQPNMQNLLLAPLAGKKGGAGGGRVMFRDFNWKVCTQFHTDGVSAFLQNLTESSSQRARTLNTSFAFSVGGKEAMWENKGSLPWFKYGLDNNYSSLVQVNMSQAQMDALALEGYVGLDLASPCLARDNLDPDFETAVRNLPDDPKSYEDWGKYYTFMGYEEKPGRRWMFSSNLKANNFGTHVLTAIGIGAVFSSNNESKTESTNTKFALAAASAVTDKQSAQYSTQTESNAKNYTQTQTTQLMGGENTKRACSTDDTACVENFLTSASTPAGQESAVTYSLRPLWKLLPIIYANSAATTRTELEHVMTVMTHLEKAYGMMSQFFWRCSEAMCPSGCSLLGDEFRCDTGCPAGLLPGPTGSCYPKVACAQDEDCEANAKVQKAYYDASLGASTYYPLDTCMYDPLDKNIGMCVASRDMDTFAQVGWTYLKPCPSTWDSDCPNSMCGHKGGEGSRYVCCPYNDMCTYLEDWCAGKPVGEECKHNCQCLSGNCRRGACSQVNRPDGMDCEANGDCEGGHCNQSMGGKCGYLKVGEACPNGTDDDCVNRACGHEDGEGSKYVCCPHGSMCPFSLFRTEDWCAGKPGGEGCKHNCQCLSDNCEGGVCEKQVADGFPCSRDTQCVKGYCNTNTKKCGKLPDRAECPNGTDSDCASGACGHAGSSGSPYECCPGGQLCTWLEDWCAGKKTGEACEHNCQCISGNCDDDKCN